MLWTAAAKAKSQNIVLWTNSHVNDAPVEKLAERLARFDYNVLAMNIAVTDIKAPAGANLLLKSAIGLIQTKAAGNKTGVLLIGADVVICPAEADTAVQAVLQVTSDEILSLCFMDSVGASQSAIAFGLVIPAKNPVMVTPTLLSWIRSPENLMWLATSVAPGDLLSSDMEPMVRRKAQLFFDRYLKGKK
jgi:hypothetical protein